MPYFVYILYSKSQDKFYIGCSGDLLEERLRKHNTHHRGYTGRTNDWQLAYQAEYPKTSGIEKGKGTQIMEKPEKDSTSHKFSRIEHPACKRESHRFESCPDHEV